MRVHLVDLAAGSVEGINATADQDRGTTWDAAVMRGAPPEKANPADYGANADGERWEDILSQAKSYELDGTITTHTHGIVIYAQDSITVNANGRINVRDHGAPPGEQGYGTTRAATMSLYSGYGETDEATGEPLLWGAGAPLEYLDGSCDGYGGGYIVLNAPTIHLNGDLDAGSTCGQGGVVILEGNVDGTGTITASQIIHRGAI